MKIKVLILGNQSFSGKYLKQYIKNHNLLQNYDIYGLDIKQDFLGERGFRQTICNVTNKNTLKKYILDISPDYIINFIGILKSSKLKTLFALNVELPITVLEIVRKNNLKVRNILLIGSAAEYGIAQKNPISENVALHPVTPYGLSKAIQTMYAQYYFAKYHIPVTIARTFNLIGKNISQELAIGSFVEKIAKAKSDDVIILNNANSKRDYIHVNDAINAYWQILINGRPGQIYNVCSGKSYKMITILKELIIANGKNIKVRSSTKTDDLVKNIVGDNTKLKRETNWITLTDVIKSIREEHYFS
jgi:GDP-4-dehydro-6-deoxy-D-mannose reductase